jgi:uncharacterized protein DUF4136
MTGAALVLTACAARMNVSSHVERGVDFADFQTYDWGPADALPTGDPRLDNNPFFHDYFEGAVEKQMALRGFEKVEWGTPDLLLHYHANISQRFEVAGVDNEHGACSGGDCEPRAMTYEAGTLVLDIVDNYTARVVWRGWAQRDVDGVIDNQDRLNEFVNQAAVKMMAQFPRNVTAVRPNTH